ncbi:surfactin synthase thioesterase subunit [Williamsia sp. R60]
MTTKAPTRTYAEQQSWRELEQFLPPDDLVVAFVAAERQRTHRPIFLFGLSASGVLAYHVAARTPLDGIIGMTVLDQRIQAVRDRSTEIAGPSDSAENILMPPQRRF